MSEILTLSDIEEAHARIREGVLYSPCELSQPLSDLCGSKVYCKLDLLQRTGSFKERGARNALLQLDEERQKRGVIAASAGNHALGLAYHGQLLGIPVTVVMPSHAPLIKVTTCKRLGARVVQHGDGFADAKARADELREAEDLTYVHGYDDPAIIAGQGTMGLEILEQVPDLDAVVLPVGGGGLIAGVALALKEKAPHVKVIGVEPKHADCFHRALKAGRPVATTPRSTLADGLAVASVGENAFALARDRVDRLVRVGEDLLALAILRLTELMKSVVEGAAAASLAPFLGDELPELAGKKVVLALCGGNIDPVILARVIDCGLVADGRLCSFTAEISDRPGGLAHLTRVIADTGASIHEIVHDRTFSGPDVSTVTVRCTVETRDREHIGALYARLAEEGVTVRVLGGEG